MKDIDRSKEKKFEEFIEVYLLGGDPKPKSVPNSARSILAKKRSLKLKYKIFKCEMLKLPKNKRLSYEKWEEEGGLASFDERVN
jgi:hypothetical protein